MWLSGHEPDYLPSLLAVSLREKGSRARERPPRRSQNPESRTQKKRNGAKPPAPPIGARAFGRGPTLVPRPRSRIAWVAARRVFDPGSDVRVGRDRPARLDRHDAQPP